LVEGTRVWVTLALAALLIGAYMLIAATPAAAAADRVLTDGENFPSGFTVPAGQTWEFNPSADTHVTSSGNVVVLGTLRMRPAAANHEHLLQFTNVDESKFIGGGMRHADAPNDIGLWVEGAGVLDISGSPVTPWSYEWESDWSSEDDIVAAPNTPGQYSNFTQVNSAAGVPAANSLGYKAELLNLSRNVRIEGTPGGRSHILINSPDATAPQTIKYAAIRYMAPWFNGDHITGRYGLHFHHNRDGSRGSIVEGVVVRDTGNHAFVPHASHGVTLTNTIAYDVTSEAYWWDESTAELCGDNEGCNETFDLVYDSIVAAKVKPNPARQHESSAIQLGAGERMTITGSVVVGMLDSGQNVSAYHWPSKDRGIWVFVDNLAHNNESHGIFVWQNTTGEEDENHLIDGFTAYYNGGAAIDHGAYGNSYVYRNLTLLQNAQDPDLGGEQNGAIHSHALGKHSFTSSGQGATDTQEWSGVETGGAKLLVFGHNTPLEKPVRFLFCDFSEIVMTEGGNNAGGYDFIECDLNLDDFDRSNVHPGTVVRVQDGGSAFQFTGKGPQQSISPFYDNPQLPPPPGESNGFLDTSGSVFASDIVWLAEQGITSGCNPPLNNFFCPNQFVTRGQMAAFLTRALDLSGGSGNPFADDDGSIFESHIESIAAAGITAGCNPPLNNLYCPTQYVTRGQMAAFLARALSLPAGSGDPFIDDDNSVFESHIEALAASGITQGCNPPTNNRFCPKANVTRGQMAAFLHRAAGYF
jgi:hypothetical protein